MMHRVEIRTVYNIEVPDDQTLEQAEAEWRNLHSNHNLWLEFYAVDIVDEDATFIRNPNA